jgi:hypothetical protein
MAMLAMMRISSDPDELLRRKQEVIDPVAKELAGANGAIEPGGQDRGRLLIVNLWENGERWRRSPPR